MKRAVLPPLIAIALALALPACSHHPAPQPAADTQLVEMPIPLPPPLPLNPDIPIPPGVEIPTTHPTIIAPRNAVNLALHRPVTSSDPNPTWGFLGMITDGDKSSGEGRIVDVGPGRQWIQVDLGRECDIYGISIWRDYAAERIYDAMIVQLSDDADFIKDVWTVYDNDVKNWIGMGYGNRPRYVEAYQGKTIPVKRLTARYVRIWSLSDDGTEKFVEVEVYGVPARIQPAAARLPSKVASATAQERPIVEHIRALGGYVSFNDEKPRKVVEVLLTGTKATDADLKQLTGLSDLKKLHLDFTAISDAGLKHVGELKHLQMLSLGATKVTDAGLASLKPLTELRELSLGATSITGSGLEHLADTDLRRLFLDATRVTDANLQHVGRLRHLEELWLMHTEISDRGLEHLKGLSNLRDIELWSTRVTPMGMRDLTRAIPTVRFNHISDLLFK